MSERIEILNEDIQKVLDIWNETQSLLIPDYRSTGLSDETIEVLLTIISKLREDHL